MIVTNQNSALFSDHDMIAVDDAASSSFFGNVYICDAAFRSQQVSGPEPTVLNSSANGGDRWSQTQVSPAVNNATVGGRQDCAVNMDSKGTVYVFWEGTDPKTKTLAIYMALSFDGGQHFQGGTAARYAHRRHRARGSGVGRPDVRWGRRGA